MIRYLLTLHTQDSPPQGYQYPLELEQYHEDNPEKIFTPEACKTLKNYLEHKSSCTIREHHLNQMINTWIEDIAEGYRETSIHLDLPFLFEENVEKIQDLGNQELPNLFPPDLTGIEPSFGVLPSLEDIYSP
ncbi:MAG: hypothetical protein QNJ64_19245 [Crocosphaera sp.]|nr:hypothetical protein [Crocosphaera sp.]